MGVPQVEGGGGQGSLPFLALPCLDPSKATSNLLSPFFYIVSGRKKKDHGLVGFFVAPHKARKQG